jgi:hypothetical protein
VPNAAKFRQHFDTKTRTGEGAKAIDDYIKGTSVLSFSELFESLDFEEIKGELESAAEAFKASPKDLRKRQKWLFMASLFRDAQYAYRGRGWVEQVGLDNLYQENYGGGKLAADVGL